MKNEKLIKSPAAVLIAASSVEPRALYHVYQKLNRLRDLIAARDYPNAEGLAKKMEISLGTVKRYLDNLRESGAPLANDRRCGGYYFTDPYFVLPNRLSSHACLLATMLNDLY